MAFIVVALQSLMVAACLFLGQGSYITFPVTINEKQESAHIMSHLHGEGLSNSLVFAMCFSSLSITISHGGKAKNGYFHCGFQEKS